MRKFSGHVIFCEDIRIEVNRQLSYIGVFPHNREHFIPDEDGNFILPKFGIGIYLEIPPEHESAKPHVAILTIDEEGNEDLIAEETMGAIPHSPDKKPINGVTHIQLEGLCLSVGTKLAIDVTVKDETVRVGVFHSLERKPIKPEVTHPEKA